MSKVTKLTLSMPVQILKQAKHYAQIHNTSISSIVTSLFKSFSEPQKQESKIGGVASFTEASVGIISLSAKVEKPNLISEAISEKYRQK